MLHDTRRSALMISLRKRRKLPFYSEWETVKMYLLLGTSYTFGHGNKITSSFSRLHYSALFLTKYFIQVGKIRRKVVLKKNETFCKE